MSAQEAIEVEAPQTIEPFIADPDWGDVAACNKAEDPSVFHLNSGPRRRRNDEKDLVVIHPAVSQFCGHCTVRPECLTAALKQNDTNGVLGGLTASERAPLHTQWHQTGRIPLDAWKKANAPPDLYLVAMPAERVVPAATKASSGAPKRVTVPKKPEIVKPPLEKPVLLAASEQVSKPVSSASLRGQITARTSMLKLLRSTRGGSEAQMTELIEELDNLHQHLAALLA